MIGLEEPRQGNEPAAPAAVEQPPQEQLIATEDLFYWMEESEADIPLCALGFEFPAGCRFCC